MKTVEITESHYGYPDGNKKRYFEKGQTVEVANDYADLIVGKGQGKESKKAAAPAAKPQPPEMKPVGEIKESK